MTTLFRNPRLIFWVTLSMLLASSTAAYADKNDDAARAVARNAAYDGLRDFERGDYQQAVDKLGRAYSVVKVPTLGLWYARALVKVGRLVEASERYGEVVRLEPTEGKITEQKKAQADADTELNALTPRIPSVKLSVQGATELCEVIVDGTALPAKLRNFPVPVNPGTHRFGAKQGDQLVEQSATIAEGESKDVTLTFPAAQHSGSGIRPVEAAESSSPSSKPTSPSTSSSTGKSQKTIGWISLSLGGVATVAGVVTGLVVLSKRSALESNQNCIGTSCFSSEHDSLTSYNQMRTASTVAFAVGAVGLGTGALLLLTAPKPKEPGVSAWVGVGVAGVRGAY